MNSRINEVDLDMLSALVVQRTLEAPLSHFQEVSSKSILKSRESPKSPKFYHFGNDFRAGENRNHSNRISTSSGREDIFEEVL